MKMASKVLKPVGKTQEQAPVEEKFLQVQDVAHEEPQSESFVQEEKTLSEKEAEFKQKMGREESGKSDLEEERETKRVQVEDSLDSFEKERAKVQQKRVNRNIETVNQASKDQLARLRAIQADNIAKQNVGVVPSVAQDVVYQDDFMTNLVSMIVNDALMNAGKERGDYEEDHIGEKSSLFGRVSGRQKTILVNGTMVTLDEDVAEALMKYRAPILNHKSKVFRDGEILQDVPDVVDDVILGTNAYVDAKQVYLDSRFCELENNLANDRKEIDNIFVTYHPFYVSQEKNYSYGVSVDGKPMRELPNVSWGDVCCDYLPNGRRLPYVESENGYQMQYTL